MTRGDSAICGTTTTGTGTLTLAACPTPPGGIDFDVLARMFGVVNNGTTIVSYTIIEYTNNTFATAKQHEKGFGILTLGSSAGIANCTLARTTKQSSATSLDSQPATMNLVPGGGITIGTAANVLVFIGPSVMDIPAYLPYYDPVMNNAIPPVGVGNGTTGQGFTQDIHYYFPFEWRIPMLVKRAAQTMWSGYTGTNNAWVALYGIGTDGRPGRLLIDFGVIGVAGASLNTSFSAISSATHSTGFFLMPGEYYYNFRLTQSSGTAGTIGVLSGPGGRLTSSRLGSWAGTPNYAAYTNNSGVLTPAPDPAYQAGWTYLNTDNWSAQFALAPS
jgi:hypothetical protein